MSTIIRIALALLLLPVLFSCTGEDTSTPSAGQESADRSLVVSDNPEAQDPTADTDQPLDENLYVPMDSSREDMLAAAEAAEPLSAEAGTVGSTMHSFALKTYDGQVLTSDDLRGSVTMLIFWFPT